MVFSLLFAVAMSLLLLKFWPQLPFGRRLILDTSLPPGAGHASELEEESLLLGKRGTMLTPLRPAGIADIQGHRVDVVSDARRLDHRGSEVGPDSTFRITMPILAGAENVRRSRQAVRLCCVLKP